MKQFETAIHRSRGHRHVRNERRSAPPSRNERPLALPNESRPSNRESSDKLVALTPKPPQTLKQKRFSRQSESKWSNHGFGGKRVKVDKDLVLGLFLESKAPERVTLAELVHSYRKRVPKAEVEGLENPLMKALRDLSGWMEEWYANPTTARTMERLVLNAHQGERTVVAAGNDSPPKSLVDPAVA